MSVLIFSHNSLGGAKSPIAPRTVPSHHSQSHRVDKYIFKNPSRYRTVSLAPEVEERPHTSPQEDIKDAVPQCFFPQSLRTDPTRESSLRQTRHLHAPLCLTTRNNPTTHARSFSLLERTHTPRTHTLDEQSNRRTPDLHELRRSGKNDFPPTIFKKGTYHNCISAYPPTAFRRFSTRWSSPTLALFPHFFLPSAAAGRLPDGCRAAWQRTQQAVELGASLSGDAPHHATTRNFYPHAFRKSGQSNASKAELTSCAAPNA